MSTMKSGFAAAMSAVTARSVLSVGRSASLTTVEPGGIGSRGSMWLSAIATNVNVAPGRARDRAARVEQRSRN